MEGLPVASSSLRKSYDYEGWDPLAGAQHPLQYKPRRVIYMADATGETGRERKLRMLQQVSNACYACSMCDLGMRYASVSYDHAERDPHVFSSMNPSRFMVVGQNPGWEELKVGEPFVGQAGKNFDRELARHGLSRSDFYICNANRCWSPGNVRPTDLQRRRCEPFLTIEINLLKPLLVVALGAAALGALCPGVSLGDAVGQITHSTRYEVPVFTLYHPSPKNLDDGGRRGAFERQMKLLCGLVQSLKREMACKDT